MQEGKRAAIAGGGIAGLAAAIGLCQAGWQVDVFERNSESVTSQDSGLLLWPNGLSALHKLGLANDVKDLGQPLNRYLLFSHKGKILENFALDTNSFPSLGIRRSTLENTLLEAVKGCNVHYKSDCYAFKNGKEEIELFLHDHDPRQFEFLIGADGCFSHLRERMKRFEKPEYSGYMLWQGITNNPNQSTELRVITSGDIKAGIFPIDKNTMAWYVGARERVKVIYYSDNRKRKLLNLLEGWPDELLQLIDNTPEDAIHKHGAYERMPDKEWSQGKIMLTGDAAHPSSTAFWQGASMAFEDAATLKFCFSKTDVPKDAFQAFEQLRFPRTMEVYKSARHFCDFEQHKISLFGRLRKNLNKQTNERLLTKFFPFELP